MARKIFLICVLILILYCSPSYCFFLVIPEDVAMGFTTYYGFAPRIFKGNDHRIGFGFRFGEHADLQILYEFGPQTSTTPLKSKVVPGTRSVLQRRRTIHRPFLELLVRAGVLKRASYQYNIVHDTTPKTNFDNSSPSYCFFLVIPEDVAMGFTTYYGFAPRIFKGNDHRIGFGFRFGEHADLQILYEFGPQTSTTPLKSKVVPGTRSVLQRRRTIHRPFLELLVRAGVLKRASYQYNIVHDTTPKTNFDNSSFNSVH